MTKSYRPPVLTDLGSVPDQTAFNGSSSRTDFFESTAGVLQEAGTGSRDNCFSGTTVTTSPNPSRCH